jgi:hypothetical protein
MCSLNRNSPSRLAENGSRIVNPGWEAASGPAASAWEASSIVAAPTTTRTYGDQLEKMAPMPSPRCELSSLITAATNPQEIPVAVPSSAARRDRDARARPPGPKATPRISRTIPRVIRPASHQEEPGACGRPPEGDARWRNRLIPADMATAASQSRRLTVTRRLMAM